MFVSFHRRTNANQLVEGGAKEEQPLVTDDGDQPAGVFNKEHLARVTVQEDHPVVPDDIPARVVTRERGREVDLSAGVPTRKQPGRGGVVEDLVVVL